MVNRENVFESVTALYRDKREQIMGEYPLCVRFLNEKAIDVGGVSWDMFAAFYDKAFMMAKIYLHLWFILIWICPHWLL